MDWVSWDLQCAFRPLKVLHFASRFQLLGTFGELICLEATVSEQVKLILESRTYGTPRSCTHTNW